MLSLFTSMLFAQERRIKAGDDIEVIVYGHQELSRVITVSNQGTVDFPFMQSLPVDGLTLDEFREIIVNQLSRYLNAFPVVTLNYARSEKIRVNVMGMVRQPGMVDILPGSYLQGAIAEAGGLMPGARANEVVLIRKDNGRSTSNQYNLEKFLREGDLHQNPALSDGDMVLITGSQIPATVMVFGEVRNPSVFTEFNGANIVSMIMRAGGPTQDANVKKIRYIVPSGAQPKEIVINLEKYLDPANISSAPLVQAGDIIYVPPRTRVWRTILTTARDVSSVAIGLYYIFMIN